MALDQSPENLLIIRIFNTGNSNHVRIHVMLKRSMEIENNRHAARHTCSQISSRRAKNNYDTPCHILACVIPSALDYSPRS